MGFPTRRMRRLRRSASLRELRAETRLSAGELIQPFFVRPGEGERIPITSMPGTFQHTVDTLLEDVKRTVDAGCGGAILFGIPRSKDAIGSPAYDPEEVVPRALIELKERFPEFLLIADVCLCEYTDHGHCGILDAQHCVDNDATLEALARASVVYARAGADVIAPSDMMDGRVQAIRTALDAEGFEQVPILSYAAKFASAFYGPFRDAAESPPQFGDRRGYQMDPRNGREALEEIRLDLEEGADMVMVKPALPYLDIIARAVQRFDVPVAAYNVSGEMSMIEAAAELGRVDRRQIITETLLSIRRAGASPILTYWATEFAGWLAR